MLPTPHASTLAATEQRFKKGRRWGPSLLLLLFSASFASRPGVPGTLHITGPTGTVVAGDTLIYTISWGPGARATNYFFCRSVTATNGAWAVAADSTAVGKVAGTNLSATPWCTVFVTPPVKTWLTAAPWDSATFTVAVGSQNTAGSSAAVTATWTVKRKPGVPGPITVDSSLVVTGLLIRPPTLPLFLGQAKRVCAYPQFHGGAVATQTGALGCDSLRSTLWALPSGAQQRHTDSMCVVWTTSNSAVATVSAAPCAVGLRPALIWRVAERGGRFVGVHP